MTGLSIEDVVHAFEAEMRAGRDAAALAVCDALPDDEAGTAWRYHLCGRLEHKAGRHAAAAVCFERGLALLPAEAGFHSHFGCTFRCRGRPAEAERHYQRALILRPTHAPAWFYTGVVRYELGHADAEGAFRRLLALAPARAEAWFYMGVLKQERGAGAAECFRIAATADAALFEASVWRLSPLVALRYGLVGALAYYRAWAHRSPSLGRMLRSPQAPLFDTSFRLAEAYKNWNADVGSRPRFADLYDVGPAAGTMRDAVVGKVMIVAPRFIANDRRFIECDITLNYGATVRRCGLTHQVVHSDDFSHGFQHRTQAERAAAVDGLIRAIDRFSPDLVLFEGGFISSSNTITPDDWTVLKRRFGFRLATVVSDFDDGLDDYAGHWSTPSDQVIVFNPQCRRIETLAASGKLFLAHGLPFDDAGIFRPGPEPRTSDVVFVGSNVRLRSVWLSVLADAGFHVVARLHNREAGLAPPMDEYARLLGSGKLTINNGILPSGGNIITGRVFEAILSQTVLLQEGARGVEDFFVPFVHFIPYDTADELIGWTRALCADDNARRRIARDARRWMLDHYSAERFWSALLARIFGRDRPAHGRCRS